MATAYIGIGGNLGDRRRIIADAMDRLRNHEEIDVVAVSSLHETEPVGGPAGQGMFLNAAARLETTLEPDELLAALQNVENDLGRTREVHWGPRRIDLDILLFDDLVVSKPELKIPHPRMHQRRFVLAPLAEIAPETIVPGTGKTAAGLLDELAK